MSYAFHFGIYPYDLDHGLSLAESACEKYDIDFDVFMDDLFEDVIETGFTEDFTNTIIMLAFVRLRDLLSGYGVRKGHEVRYVVDGRASYLIIDGEEICC